VTAARLALEEGVVPGGGAALVGCAQSIRCARFSTDVAIAPSVLAESLLAPMRTIAHNAGCADPAYIVHQARRRAPNVAFDVVHGRWVDPYPAGLLDPLPITRTAFEVSVSLARLVVTTGALVRRRQVAPPAGR
jgi:chaperonin GroEL